METYRQVFTAEIETVAIRSIQHIIIPITQETIFGNQTKMICHLKGQTRFQSQFKTCLRIGTLILL